MSIKDTTSAPVAMLHWTFQSVLDVFPEAVCVAVDIPIGLPDTGDRRCDMEARELIRPRHNSVFPTPVRRAIYAPDYTTALAVNREVTGRGVSPPANELRPKIAEVDTLLREIGDRASTVYEVHPELCFRMWAGLPMAHAKKTTEGAAERIALIEEDWTGALESCRASLPRPGRNTYAADDLHDAFAALWTAHRISRGGAIQIPEVLERDGFGLPMRMMA